MYTPDGVMCQFVASALPPPLDDCQCSRDKCHGSGPCPTRFHHACGAIYESTHDAIARLNMKKTCPKCLYKAANLKWTATSPRQVLGSSDESQGGGDNEEDGIMLDSETAASGGHNANPSALPRHRDAPAPSRPPGTSTSTPTRSFGEGEGEGYDPPLRLLAVRGLPDEHITTRMKRINALFKFVDITDQREREAIRRREEEERRRASDEEKAAEETAYPSKHFIRADPNDNSDDGILRLKGTVEIPSGESTTRSRVEAFALFPADRSKGLCLMILRRLDQNHSSLEESHVDSFFPAICEKSVIPRGTYSNVCQKDDTLCNRRRHYSVENMNADSTLSAVAVKRNEIEKPLNMLICNSGFQGHVCCDDMLASLRSGVVGIKARPTKETKGKKRYFVLRQPFHEGRFHATAYKLLVSSSGGTMILSADDNSDVARMIFDTAQRAREALFGDPLTSFLSARQKVVEASEASHRPLKYDVYLNVALGGSPCFPPYGRIIPCTAEHPAFDCTCDVALDAQNAAASELITKNKRKHATSRRTYW